MDITALAFANDNAMFFYETSAKESMDVDIAFANVLKSACVCLRGVCVCMCACVCLYIMCMCV